MNGEKVSFRSDTLFYGHTISAAPPCDLFSVHTHNMYELLYFIRGDATHVIEDRKYKLKKGDLILIKPQKYHFIRIDSSADYERYNILFDEAALGIDCAEKVGGSIEVINLGTNAIADNIFRKIDYYFEHMEGSDFEKVMKLLLGELFLNLSIETDITQSEYSVINPLLSKALRYINDNLFTVKDVGEVARELFVTESYLFRLFKNELKNSPKKYITDKRLLKSQNLIRLGEKPTKVYEKCGFSDYTSFYRSYVRFFGHPPSKDGCGR